MHFSIRARSTDDRGSSSVGTNLCSPDLPADDSGGVEPREVNGRMTLPIAQCVMCFRTAAAQQLERARVLNEGILVLLIPPLAIICLLFWMARRRTRDSQSVQPDPQSDR